MLIVLFIELGTYLIDIPFAGFNSVGRVGKVKRLVINFPQYLVDEDACSGCW